MTMLKADLHIHTKGDPQDTQLDYTPKDIIRIAAKQKFDVLAITWHNKICDVKPLESFAKKKGILLIPGIEATIEGKHTLLYNATKEEIATIKTHDDIYALKDHVAIGAPHPFFKLPICLGRKVFEHSSLFDFVEHSHFYTKHINFNEKAVLAAKQLNIPVVANSDVHFLSMFGKDFTMIDAEKNTDAVLDALKKKAHGKNKKRIQPQTRPYKFLEFIKNGIQFAPTGTYRIITGNY